MTISLEQSAYTVSEADGMVEVCAVITQGVLAQGQFVLVQLSTMDGSAGEFEPEVLNLLTTSPLPTQWLGQTTPV